MKLASLKIAYAINEIIILLGKVKLFHCFQYQVIWPEAFSKLVKNTLCHSQSTLSNFAPQEVDALIGGHIDT